MHQAVKTSTKKKREGLIQLFASPMELEFVARLKELYGFSGADAIRYAIRFTLRHEQNLQRPSSPSPEAG